MQAGLSGFATDYAIRPDELARAGEQRGFESSWFPEHTHIPASRRTPWPGATLSQFRAAFLRLHPDELLWMNWLRQGVRFFYGLSPRVRGLLQRAFDLLSDSWPARRQARRWCN